MKCCEYGPRSSSSATLNLDFQFNIIKKKNFIRMAWQISKLIEYQKFSFLGKRNEKNP